MKNLILAFTVLASYLGLAQDFKGVAYIPSYRMTHISDLNYDLITHVMASFINPDEQGNMSWVGDIDQFVQTVHANNAKACISIGGGGDYSWGNKVYIYEDLLATPASRTSFISKIMDYCRLHKVDGVDNDMEGSALALANFNIFTQELADSCHAQNLEISAAIGVGGSWGSNLFTDATLEKLDYLMTMSYGGVGNWNWHTKVDEHTYAKMVSDMENFTVTRGVPQYKVIGGIPFYTVEFPNQAQESYGAFHQTICQVLNDPQFAGQDPQNTDTLTTTEGHTVYINGLRTIKKKMDYCDQYGGGVMIWEAGQDCFDGSYSMMDSMATYKNAQGLAVSTGTTDQVELLGPNPTNHRVKFNKSCTWSLFNSHGQLLQLGTGDEISLVQQVAGLYIVTVGNKQWKINKL